MSRQLEHYNPTPAAESLDSRQPKDITVIMPIGGLALRAHEITHGTIPKHLIRLDNGRTVLETICRGLQKVGFRKFAFSVCHQKEQLMSYLRKEEWITHPDTEYRFSTEPLPRGPDSAAVKAISELALKGYALITPGDLLLPWQAVADMSRRHMAYGSDITFGVTSVTNSQTTDVANIVAETDTDRLLWTNARSDQGSPPLAGAHNLTSAAATMVSIERFKQLLATYADEHPDKTVYPTPSLRDEIMPWAVNKSDFQMHVYDLHGEILDLGTPERIRYGQQHWQNYDV